MFAFQVAIFFMAVHYFPDVFSRHPEFAVYFYVVSGCRLWWEYRRLYYYAASVKAKAGYETGRASAAADTHSA